MKSHSSRLSKLEKQNPPETQFYVMIYGENGRVQYGSDELIGMTLEEVDAYFGPDVITRRVGVELDRI